MHVRYAVMRGQPRALCPSGGGANAKLKTSWWCHVSFGNLAPLALFYCQRKDATITPSHSAGIGRIQFY